MIPTICPKCRSILKKVGKDKKVCNRCHIFFDICNFIRWEALYDYSIQKYIIWQENSKKKLIFDNMQDLRQYVKEKGLNLKNNRS